MTMSDMNSPTSIHLRNALDRLTDLRRELDETRHHAELGEEIPTAQLERQLDEVDQWLNDVTAIFSRRSKSI
jgi:hypothetical protein